MLKHLHSVLPAFLLLISCTSPQPSTPIVTGNDYPADPATSTAETPLPPAPLTAKMATPDGKAAIAAEAIKPASTAVPVKDNETATAGSVPVLTPSATPASQPAATWTPVPAPAVITGQPVNIRRGPGLFFDVIAGPGAGQRADILGRNPAGDWWQIRINAQRLGWVFAGVVDTEGETAAITVATDIQDPPPFRVKIPQPNRSIALWDRLTLCSKAVWRSRK